MCNTYTHGKWATYDGELEVKNLGKASRRAGERFVVVAAHGWEGDSASAKNSSILAFASGVGIERKLALRQCADC